MSKKKRPARQSTQRNSAKAARRKTRLARRARDTLELPPTPAWNDGLLPPGDTAVDDAPFDPPLHDILVERGWVLEHQDNDSDSYMWPPSQPDYPGSDKDAMPTGINVANPTGAALNEIRAGIRSARPSPAYQVEFAGVGDAYIGSPDFPTCDYPDRAELIAALDAIEIHRAPEQPTAG
ncbi:hypothetical protein [Mycobacteroides abscessus]|uniref:hypothetical protein n=1 Tax=Mycobacteroides abscessus TaxID=36809 RepID=UPI00092AA792|nr:hypothetical protein [Mycobacteroides abscessus]SIN56252.1 Uncharacterised protein [Mycobacteroides abscessus subsp. abscessus]